MSVMPAVDLIRTAVLDEVLAALSDEHVPYAGATELVPAMRLGVRHPVSIVDLKRLPELRGISEDSEAGVVHIGSTTTHREIASNAIVLELLPTIAVTASRIGNARVRTSGTLGGNLCFAEPRSDLSTVLIALGATAEVAASGRTRTVAIDELIVGAFETCLASDELLVRVSVPFEPAGMTYWKLHSYERPTLGVAAVPDADGWRVVVGAATERPVTWLLGRGDHAGLEQLVADIELSDDLSGSTEYKRAVLLGYLRRLLDGALTSGGTQ